MIEAGLASGSAGVEIEPDISITHDDRASGACQPRPLQAKNVSIEIAFQIHIAADNRQVLHLCKHDRPPSFRSVRATLVDREANCQPALGWSNGVPQ